jgi:predicted nuclease of predicted toxin-antitoxin system
MKIKLDENLSRHLKQILEQDGHDVETVEDEGLSGRNDLEVGTAAREEGRMLFTLDVEFADLRKYPPGTHPGVILFRPRTMGPLTVNNLVVEFVRTTNLDELAKCVVIVDRNKVRVRYPNIEI